MVGLFLTFSLSEGASYIQEAGAADTGTELPHQRPCDDGQVNTSSATKEDSACPISPASPALGILTVIQWHLPLWGASIGFQVAIVPRERGDEAGVVDGAHRPLLLVLGEVWPRKQQDIGKGSAHQHLSLEETRTSRSEEQHASAHDTA